MTPDAIDVIRRCEADFGKRIALRDTDREITYGALVENARALAAAWTDAGLPRGARVAVLLDNGIELAVTEWACLLGGCVWIGLNVRTSRTELESILVDSDPSMLVYGGRQAELVASVALAKRCRRVVVDASPFDWDALLERGREALERGVGVIAPEAEEAVRVRYTSGTAGTPKGAVLPRRCYDASLAAVAEAVAPITAADTLVHVAPMTHASGAMFLPHAAVGARAIVLPRFDVPELVATIERERATALFVVPTMLVRMVEEIEDPMRVASLRTVVYGGASMPTDRLQRALERFGPIFVQIYGLTESTWPVCALSRRDHERRRGESDDSWTARLRSCGRPTSVGALRVVGDDDRDVATGEVGEIRVRGRNTMSGYWLRDGAGRSESKGLDADGWMRTGDVGFRNEEGFVTIVDRLHDMIISGGFNVYPREVENVLSRHPAVFEAAVVGRADPEWGETVHAAVVLRAGEVASVEELIAHCAASLPGYKKPRSLEIVAELPKNSAGKVLRRKVRDQARGSSATQA